VSAWWSFWPPAPAEAGWVRRVADAVLRARGRRDLARFDRQSAARCQLRILRGLVHRARRTRFGRDHDFRRVHTEADFRRLVPLRTPAELHHAYWRPAFPNLAGATWPGPLPHLETFTASPPDGAACTLAVSPALQAARRAAWRTALALVGAARPQARLLSGRLLVLGDGAASAPAGTAPAAAARGGLPGLVRPYALTAPGDDALAERVARTPVTLLAGPAARVAALLDRVRRAAGVWPTLTAVLYARRGPDDSAARLREALGDRVLLLETGLLPEGPVAVEDPRRGGLRLLTDHGVYFEFTPAGEAGRPGAARHGLGEVETGVDYEVVLSSPAGVWACRTGVAVRFARRDPPLLRLAALPAPAAVPAAAPAVTAFPTQPPHRRTAGIPAAPPGTFVHSPWSAPADRG
jgi:hypothetical protein